MRVCAHSSVQFSFVTRQALAYFFSTCKASSDAFSSSSSNTHFSWFYAVVARPTRRAKPGHPWKGLEGSRKEISNPSSLNLPSWNANQSHFRTWKRLHSQSGKDISSQIFDFLLASLYTQKKTDTLQMAKMFCIWRNLHPPYVLDTSHYVASDMWVTTPLGFKKKKAVCLLTHAGVNLPLAPLMNLVDYH